MVWLLTETSDKNHQKAAKKLQFTVMYPQDAATSCKYKQVEDYPYSESTTSSSQSIIEAKSSKALSSVLQRKIWKGEEENGKYTSPNTESHTLDNNLYFSFSSLELTALKNKAIKRPFLIIIFKSIDRNRTQNCGILK